MMRAGVCKWLLMAALAGTIGCGGSNDTPPGNICTAENCHGCCDASGNCVAGVSGTYCGRGGDTCQMCAVTEVCVEGGCVADVQCSPTTCQGCCLGTVCMAGHELSACGKAGKPCDVCVDSELCVLGICGLVCDPSTCTDGCCLNGECIKAEQQGANLCGGVGEACVACGDGEQCVEQRCELVGCELSTCTGCCDDKGNCRT
ncbi:MAG: hypothetical protein JRH20_24840, partial [Deltaproteobacteria bacterium]|nr:hypothetical protein [Deltaproteobacteria bacterium]